MSSVTLPTQKSVSFELPNGRTVEIETGKLAKQAHGSVVLTCGKTKLLATVVSSYDLREGQDFFPLSVDYQEKFASAGKIPGGFLKREGRLSDQEVLVCRLVDRALRPMFPDGYMYETQVLISLISHDDEVKPDALVALASSAAISVSDIPFNGPISETRVARVNGEYIVNASPAELEEADMDIILAADMNNILMVEGEMHEVSEEELVEAMKVGHDAIKVQCQAQIDLANQVGVEKRPYEAPSVDEEVMNAVKTATYDKFYAVLVAGIANKSERKEQFSAISDEYIASLGEDPEEELLSKVKSYLKDVQKAAIRKGMIDTQKRLDGRNTDEVRPLWMEVDYLPSAHGSALFTRGETQSLTSVTLGTKLDEQMIDGATFHGYNKFILHYNFPPFSTGESRPQRGPGRREVGHGNLAMRSIKQVLPEDYPYTVRVVSDILESNGSSSMATVCAASLALMDTGVEISSAVSGIAMGMVSEGDEYAILSDILGDEDHLGDMDFKVTGTEKGICATQMDIKIDGLSYEVLVKALKQAREGRLHILKAMKECIPAPAAELKPHAPRMEFIEIEKDFIGAVIGPGGKIIQKLQEDTNTTITIEEVDNKGHVYISATNKDDITAALSTIKGIVAVPEVGEVYDAVVKSIQPYGAFVEFMPGKEGLVHISELRWERLEKVEDVLKDGEDIQVKLMGKDPKTGKFKLSHKVLLEKPEGFVEKKRDDRPKRDGNGGKPRPKHEDQKPSEN